MPAPSQVPTAAAIATTTRMGLPSGSSFDLTGYSTLALAVVTVALAIAAFRQAYLSRKAIDATRTETERAFAFEQLREIQSQVPIIIAEATAKKPTFFRFLALRNVGQGPAVNVRFSGVIEGNMFTAAQYSAAAVGAGGVTPTALQLHKDFEQRWPIKELLIRYDDVFGNTYSTEYVRFEEGNEWYEWRRPWLGKDLGLPKPPQCSEDEPSWGFNSRAYYDALNGLY